MSDATQTPGSDIEPKITAELSRRCRFNVNLQRFVGGFGGPWRIEFNIIRYYSSSLQYLLRQRDAIKAQQESGNIVLCLMPLTEYGEFSDGSRIKGCK